MEKKFIIMNLYINFFKKNVWKSVTKNELQKKFGHHKLLL